jgi:protein TonB
MIVSLAALALAAAAPPASPGTQSSRPSGPMTMEDYPADALRQHAQGLVRVALDIDENGRVTACRIVTSSGHPSLDAATCRILTTRARFTAARDEQGRPIKDVVTTQINWRIPE